MRRLLFIAVTSVFLLNLPVSASDVTLEASETGTHGSEALALDEHGVAADGEHHEAETFLGLPVWIWKLANMVLFLFILYRLMAGPLSTYFATRKREIRDSLERAEQRRVRAEKMSEEINAKITALEGEIVSIRERADDEGKRIASQIAESTDRDLEKVKASARNEIEQRLSTARRELRKHAATLASERAEEILESSITEADRDRIFGQGLARLEEAGS